MRQQAGLLEHQCRCIGKILKRSGVTAIHQPASRHSEAGFGPVAKREQRLTAPGRLTGTCDVQHL